MVTTSNLNNNLLLLSSKRTHSLRSSLCRFKTLQFGAYSNFSGFKVESLSLSSTSSSRINNSAAVSFYADSSLPQKFSSKTAASDEVESFNLNLISGSTNKDNVIKKALNLLKSKVPALLMASCLMLGMMMISCHKPALAFRGKHLLSLSSSSPSSRSSSSLSSARGCIFCSDKPPIPHRIPFFGPLGIGQFCVLCCLFVCAVAILVKIFLLSFISIFKIQVGLLVGKDLQRDLILIAKTLEGCTSSAWKTILEDTIETLDWHCSNWICGYSSGSVVWDIDGEHFFENLSYEESKKFDKERPINLRNANAKSITSRVKETDEFKNKFIVVTLLVAFEGWHNLPTMHKREDLHRVLKKLKSYNSNTEIEGIDVLWVPQKDGEIMSREQLENNYPHLRPLNTNKYSLAFKKFVNRIFNF